MPIPLDFLRGVLGLLLVFFAHLLGRSLVRVQRGRQKPRNLYGWLLRTVIAAGAVLWRRGFDGVAIAEFVLAALALAAGVWDERRPKRQEDLTRQMFPEA